MTEVLPDLSLAADAVFSPNGSRRYALTRRFSLDPASTLLVIMLNPSTADAQANDPTIRRVMGFAKRDGYGSVWVHNLIPICGTDPRRMVAGLLSLPVDDRLALRADNLQWLGRAVAAIRERDEVGQVDALCAWGVNAPDAEASCTLSYLRRVGVNTLCLGLAGSGVPRHPLYVRGDRPMVDFTP